jgi:hypothetical protein
MALLARASRRLAPKARGGDSGFGRSAICSKRPGALTGLRNRANLRPPTPSDWRVLQLGLSDPLLRCRSGTTVRTRERPLPGRSADSSHDGKKLRPFVYGLITDAGVVGCESRRCRAVIW